MSSPRERILAALETARDEELVVPKVQAWNEAIDIVERELAESDAENKKLREAFNKITDWDIERLRKCGDHPDWQTFLHEFHEGERLLERATTQSNFVTDAPMVWQPIETAPMDDSKLLLAWFKPYPDGQWHYEVSPAGNVDIASERHASQHADATYWMPLPAPPSEVSSDDA